MFPKTGSFSPIRPSLAKSTKTHGVWPGFSRDHLNQCMGCLQEGRNPQFFQRKSDPIFYQIYRSKHTIPFPEPHAQCPLFLVVCGQKKQPLRIAAFLLSQKTYRYRRCLALNLRLQTEHINHSPFLLHHAIGQPLDCHHLSQSTQLSLHERRAQM